MSHALPHRPDQDGDVWWGYENEGIPKNTLIIADRGWQFGDWKSITRECTYAEHRECQGDPLNCLCNARYHLNIDSYANASQAGWSWQSPLIILDHPDTPPPAINPILSRVNKLSGSAEKLLLIAIASPISYLITTRQHLPDSRSPSLPDYHVPDSKFRCNMDISAAIFSILLLAHSHTSWHTSVSLAQQLIFNRNF